MSWKRRSPSLGKGAVDVVAICTCLICGRGLSDLGQALQTTPTQVVVERQKLMGLHCVCSTSSSVSFSAG